MNKYVIVGQSFEVQAPAYYATSHRRRQLNSGGRIFAWCVILWRLDGLAQGGAYGGLAEVTNIPTAGIKEERRYNLDSCSALN